MYICRFDTQVRQYCDVITQISGSLLHPSLSHTHTHTHSLSPPPSLSPTLSNCECFCVLFAFLLLLRVRLCLCDNLGLGVEDHCIYWSCIVLYLLCSVYLYYDVCWIKWEKFQLIIGHADSVLRKSINGENYLRYKIVPDSLKVVWKGTPRHCVPAVMFCKSALMAEAKVTRHCLWTTAATFTLSPFKRHMPYVTLFSQTFHSRARFLSWRD